MCEEDTIDPLLLEHVVDEWRRVTHHRIQCCTAYFESPMKKPAKPPVLDTDQTPNGEPVTLVLSPLPQPSASDPAVELFRPRVAAEALVNVAAVNVNNAVTYLVFITL